MEENRYDGAQEGTFASGQQSADSVNSSPAKAAGGSVPPSSPQHGGNGGRRRPPRWKQVLVVALVSLVGMAAGGGLFFAWAVPAPVAQQAGQVHVGTSTVPAAGQGNVAGSDQGSLTPAQVLTDTSTPVTQVYKAVGQSVVMVNTEQAGYFSVASGLGSGFYIDKEGDVATNYHVVAGAQRLSISLPDGTTVNARVVGYDPGNDLAIIRPVSSVGQVKPIPLGDSDQVQVGELAIAIGNPFGHEGTVTAGIISALGRAMPAPNQRQIQGMLQTDAAINPGNSGGPLLNARGEVIGINTAIDAPNGVAGQGGSVGIGFAVPINTLKGELDRLLAGGEVQHAWLGIQGATVTPDMVRQLSLDVDQGVLVDQVLPGSPAEKAGLSGATVDRRSGQADYSTADVITAVNGKPIKTIEELTQSLEQIGVGNPLTLAVHRQGKDITLKSTVGTWPSNLN